MIAYAMSAELSFEAVLYEGVESHVITDRYTIIQTHLHDSLDEDIGLKLFELKT